jgi:hypothetical protein
MVDVQRIKFFNDSIVCTGFEPEKTRAYLEEFRERGFINIGLLLMAQEYSGKDTGNLGELSDYHLRTYYFPESVGLGGYGQHVCL